MENNTMNDMFIKATREKMRFNFKGVITVEDLWDLSLNNLRIIYTNLKEELNKISTDDDLFEVDAVDKKTAKEIDTLNTGIEIIRYIVKVKKEEAEVKKKAAENAALKKKLVSILADKQEEAYKNLSEEELLKKINEL